MSLVLALLFWLLPASDGPTYSVEPYADPVHDAETNAKKFEDYNAWLAQNYATSPPHRKPELQQGLYRVIDSHLRLQFADNGEIAMQQGDPLLIECFGRASEMGIPGAEILLGRLSGFDGAGSSVELPTGFRLTLDGPWWRLGPIGESWTAVFPSHFMIANSIQRDTPIGQNRMAMISTGFAQPLNEEGESFPATIELIHRSSGDPVAFRDFWLEQKGIPLESARGAAPVEGFPSYKKYDFDKNRHHEFVFLDVGRHNVAVGLVGASGVYEWNRPHYIDFVRELRAALTEADATTAE